MNLAPKARGRLLAFAQSGYAMAALLVAMSVMAIVLSAAMPVWSQMIRRDKEEELIFRGNQYARAINQYQRKFASASPASLDVLIEQRLLRKKFRDPMSPNKDGEFQLLYLQNQATMGTQGLRAGSGSRSGPGSRSGVRGKEREVAVDRVALQSAARSGPRRAAAVPLSASPARTLASPSRPIKARTTTTSGSSSEWRYPHRACRADLQDNAAAGLSGEGRAGATAVEDREADERVAPQSQHATAPSRFRQAGLRAVHPHARAVSTASCSAGRICWMAVFSRVGFTRFVRNTTYRSRSGSIHNEVPVNPV